MSRGVEKLNIHKTYETLKARGVEFNQEPTDRGYGTDIGVRDRFGNHIRIVQFAGEVNQAAPKSAAKA